MLKVIGAGMGRTGTYSLKLALEQLGFAPCYHMYEIRDNPALLPDWQAAVHGEKLDWHSVFEGYNAQVDWPGSLHWRELARAFPEAKVILSVRDPDSWFDSIQATIVPSVTIGRVKAADAHTRDLADMVYQSVYRQRFHDQLEDRAEATRIFSEHIQEVQSEIDPNRLLTYEVRSGWAPLCDFLGVDIPDAPFPSTNSISEFRAKKAFLD